MLGTQETHTQALRTSVNPRFAPSPASPLPDSCGQEAVAGRLLWAKQAGVGQFHLISYTAN